MLASQNQKRFRRLAIQGGTPAFGEKLYVGSPNLGNKDRLLERMKDVLDSGWLTNNGRYVRDFEQRITRLIGVKHCIVVCNATIGLEIVIRALELQGEVIVPSFTFAATAHALKWQGITPVFCDVDPLTHSLDPRDVERRITLQTTGIMGVHLWGNACDITALEKIASDHRLALLFDAAHAFGCSHNGRMIGNFGQAEVFSFHATKFCNSFEGGAITTNDDQLAERLRAIRNFGISQDDLVTEVGTNGKMSEISAAMGITSLESLNEIVEINRNNYVTYKKYLGNIAGIRLVDYDEAESNNFQYVVMEIDEKTAGLSRDQLHRILQEENVVAKKYFYPGCHRMAPYRSTLADLNPLPVTERLAEGTLALPTGSAVNENDVMIISEIITTALRQASRVRQVLFSFLKNDIAKNTAAKNDAAIPNWPDWKNWKDVAIGVIGDSLNVGTASGAI